MFITVTVGGMLAIAGTAAASGAFAGLYARGKLVKVVRRTKAMVGALDENHIAHRVRVLYSKISERQQ